LQFKIQLMKKYIVFLALLLFFACQEQTTQTVAIEDEEEIQHENPFADTNVEAVPFEREDGRGWGYDIKIDGQPFVHQPHIPAVSGDQGFASEADAKKAGELVAYKIRNNILPPSVTVEELDSIGVLE
jgi:hypothetical protein